MDANGDAARAMAARIVHRGPDDEGIYVDSVHCLSLAARRLSVIDVAGGHQPVANEDDSVWAVLNGEIYNHRSLREDLRREGHAFKSETDTEVLVHLYERSGERLVDELEGMYAFAIWDRRERRLLLGRDRFGEKPLFYALNGRGLTFASELTALLAGLDGHRDIEPEALDAFFVLGYIPGERTIFRNVLQLAPASTLSWSATSGEVTTRRYWQMPEQRETGKQSVAELAERAGELLAASVASRLYADVPVGVFLSGGLDSMLVGALAARHVSGRLKTFTVSYDMGTVSEAEQARATAERIGSEHTQVTLTSHEIAQRVAGVAGGLDQPNADPALVALHAVAEQARQSVTVAVGGEGADELFGGYPRYRWMRRSEAVRRRISPAAAMGAAGALRLLPGARAARLADVVSPMELAQRNLDWTTGGRRHLRGQIYGPRLAGCLRRDVALEDVESLLSAEGDCGGDGVARLMRLDQRRYLPDDVLAKADRATMMVSLEMRTPYLSRELAEFSAGIPTSLHLSGGGKRILREVARKLPEISGAGRAKRAFGVPVSQWLRDPLLGLLRGQAHEGRIVTEGWIDPTAMRAAIEDHRRGTADNSAVLWPLLIAGLWVDRRFAR